MLLIPKSTSGADADMAAQLRALGQQRIMAVFTPEGVLVEANDVFLRTLGYTAEQVLGQSHRLFCEQAVVGELPPDAAASHDDSLWQELRLGQPLLGNFLRYDSQGRALWWQASYLPVLDELRRVRSVLLLAHDVTVQRHQDLAQAAAMDAINRSQAIVEFDMRGTIVHANDRFLLAMDYRLDEVRGQHHRILCATAQSQGLDARHIWDQLHQGRHVSGEVLLTARYGRPVWMQATYAPMFDLEGQPCKVVMFAADISAAKARAAENTACLAALAADSLHFELDAQGRYTHVNAAFETLLSASAAELLGKPDRLFGSAAAGPWLELQAGRSCRPLLHWRDPAGCQRWLELALSPLRDAHGQLVKVFGLGRDVTAERQHRLDCEGKLAAIDRSQALVVYDPQGRVLDANARYLDLLGYPRDEVLGQPHTLFVEDLPAARQAELACWDRLASGAAVSGEFMRRCKDGRPLWLQITCSPVLDGEGRVVQVIQVATDVTRARLDNAACQAQVQAVDLSHAVAEFDLDGRLITANRNFLAAMGYTLRELVGRHHAHLCTPQYRLSEEYRDFWLRLNEGQPISGRFQRVGQYGREVWIQATYSPILDLNGRPSKVIKYAYDVTREVQLERRIIELAQRTHHSVDQLTSSMTAIARRSGVAAELALNARSSAQNGLTALQQALAAIAAMQSNSERVRQIVARIGDLAEQTHMLAFNAAIEAARAGPQGTGFTVLARAVRMLAERSEQAAQETARLVDGSAESVLRGAAITQEVAASLLDILDRADRTGLHVQHIATASDSQKLAASDMLSAMRQLLDSQPPTLRLVA